MNYVNGSDLQTGRRYRCIATGDGAIVNNESRFLVTDVTDRKENKLVVNVADGAAAYATPTSVWSEV